MPTPVYYPQLDSRGLMAPSGMSSGHKWMTLANDPSFAERDAFAYYGAGLGATLPPGPLGRWTLPYTQLTDAQRDVLEDFFNGRLARYLNFTFLDPMGNLVQSSENFTDSSWTGSASAPGASDPFGGSLGSAATAGSLITTVLPDGHAPSGFVLTGSVYALAASPQMATISFTDGSSVLSSTDWSLPAGKWIRISNTISIATTAAIHLAIILSADTTLFGAQCAPLPGPGGYVQSPTGYGLHEKCRFDMDALEINQIGPNANNCTVTIQEVF